MRKTTIRQGGAGWGPDRQVRAEVLAALLCGVVEVAPGQPGGATFLRPASSGSWNSGEPFSITGCG